MKLTELSVGFKLEVHLFEGENNKTSYMTSRFEGAESDEVAIIRTPFVGGQLHTVSVGQEMKILFHFENYLRLVKAKIVEVFTQNNISMMKIKIKGLIEKIQRREFYRFDKLLDVAYVENDEEEAKQSEETEGSYKIGTCINLSGGGIALRTDGFIETNKTLRCKLKFDEDKSIDFSGKVVWSRKNDENSAKYDLGIWFQEISYSDREAIIKYIFSEQRKYLK